MSVLTLDESRASDFSRHDGQVRPEISSTFDLPLSIPLVVDLDGTLIAGDMFYKSFFEALRRNPFIVLPCIGWFWRGRAALKRELALRCRIDFDRLKLHQDVLALLLREKAVGRSVVLATAADALLAEQIAARLRVFDRVIASDGSCNLKGLAKAQALSAIVPRRLHLCRRQQGRSAGVAARPRHRRRQRPQIGRGGGAFARTDNPRTERPHRPLRLASAGQTVKIPDSPFLGSNPERPSWTPVRAAITRSTRAGSATRKAFGARRRPPSTGSKSPKPCSIRTRASTAAGSSTASATPASTRSTAMSMPGAASRRRSSTTRRSPAKNAPSPITAC